jgi:hypothetical protein
MTPNSFLPFFAPQTAKMKVAGLLMLFAAGATAFMTPAPRTTVSLDLPFVC